MSDKSDRVQKWGELLAELANDAKKFDREKRDKLLAQKQKYRDFYKILELEAANFQPKKFQQRLSQSLKNNLATPIIVFSFTCDLAKQDDYRDVVLNAFKSKAFLLRPLKVLLQDFIWFVAIP